MWGLLPAMAGYAGLYGAYLANLPADKRAAVMAENRRRREDAELEASPEVQFARAEILREDLVDKNAERLLEFARDLARRRS